jgi:F-type H+-transporting ATPase subunit epsilon
MHCQLQSPEGTLFNGEAKIVVARSHEGQFAIMDKHAPLLAALEASPLTIKTEEQEHVFALSGGVIQVRQASVTILAYQAIPLAKIDVAEVKARRQELEKLVDKDVKGDNEHVSATQEEIAFLNVQAKLGESLG